MSLECSICERDIRAGCDCHAKTDAPRAESSGAPSEVAVAVARRVTREAQRGSGRLNSQHVRTALDAAHDPALGLDRSVCLRDIWLWMDQFKDGGAMSVRRLLMRDFGGEDLG